MPSSNHDKDNMKRTFIATLAVALTLGITACGESGSSPESNSQKDANAVRKVEKARGRAYIPTNSVEFNNYNRAQKLYDSPSTIIWCTTTFSNPSAPIVTIPIAGKLTSSSVSYFPSRGYVDRGNYTFTDEERKSVDGMYHGTPGPYRYGFTPGGQYVDFTNLSVYCTTSLTKFQRQKTEISVETDPQGDAAQTKAEKILADGTNPSTGVISPKAKSDAQKALTQSGLEGSK